MTYYDKVTQHEIFVQRFASYLNNNYPQKNLETSKKAVLRILGEMQGQPVNQITRAIEKELMRLGVESWRGVSDELKEFAEQEAKHFAKTFEAVHGVALTIPPAKSVAKYVAEQMIVLGHGATQQAGLWSDYVKASNADVVKMVNNQVRAGLGDGETLRQISQRIDNATGGVLKNRVEALVRTALNHYSIQAKEAVVAQNHDVIESRYFNSVFDNRRTLICSNYASSDENPWKITDTNYPKLPLHFGERSNWVFLLKGQKAPDGTRASVGGQDTKEAADRYNRRKEALETRRNNPNIESETSSQVKYRGRKDSDTFKAGQIKAETKADDWLRDQPRWFVESNMGKERARLFLDEGYNINSFVDEVTGRELTLKELYAMG